MKIKDLQSAKFYKKCLLAKELQAFSQCCSVDKAFSDLSEDLLMQGYSTRFSSSSKATTIIDRMKSMYLPLAEQGDLSFLDDHYFKSMLNRLPNTDMQSEICSLFSSYSYYSQKYSDFKEANSAFDSCIIKNKDGSVSISERRLDRFRTDMSNYSEEFKKFDEHFKKSLRTHLGHKHYLITQNALKTLNTTNPEFINNSKSLGNVTPETYFSDVSSYFSQYHKKPIFYGPKGQKMRRVAAAMFAVATFATLSIKSSNDYENIKESNEINIDNAEELGYSSNLSEETLVRLGVAQNQIDNLTRSSVLPQREQFETIMTDLDEIADLIVADLAKPAIESAHPEWRVTNVDTYYNLNSAKNEESPERIIVEYIDENGNEKRLSIQNFGTTLLHRLTSPGTTIEDGIFGLEQNADNNFSGKTEDNYHHNLSIAFSPNSTMDEKTDALRNLVNYFNTTIENLKIIAAKQMTYKDGLIFSDGKLTLVMPEKAITESELTDFNSNGSSPIQEGDDRDF